MLVKIVAGYYGHTAGGLVRAKGPKDPPFELPDEEARRIIGLGIAKAADGEEIFINEPADPAASGGEGGFEIPEYSKDSPKDVLHSIAKEYGVEIAPNATKAEIAAALDNFFADALPDEDTE